MRCLQLPARQGYLRVLGLSFAAEPPVTGRRAAQDTQPRATPSLWSMCCPRVQCQVLVNSVLAMLSLVLAPKMQLIFSSIVPTVV